MKQTKKKMFGVLLAGIMSISGLGISAVMTETPNLFMSLEVSAASIEQAMFPGSTLRVTQGAYRQYRAYSHFDQNAFDLGGNTNYAAPFTGKIVAIDKKYNAVTLQSTNKVRYADGSTDYMTVTFVHDNDISNLKVNQVIKQGTIFYQPGVKDPTGKTTGTHLHLCVKRGKVNTVFYSGNVYPNNALFLKNGTKVVDRGVYEWKYSDGRLINDGTANNDKNNPQSSVPVKDGKIYTIAPKGKSLYLSASGTKNCSNVCLNNKVNNASKWKAHKVGNSWYFENMNAAGKVLDIYGSSVTKSGQNVQIYAYNKASTEYFNFKSVGGYWILQTTKNGIAIDCQGSSSTLKNNSNVWTYSINNDATQLFKFTQVG